MKAKYLILFALLAASLLQGACDAFVNTLRETKSGPVSDTLTRSKPTSLVEQAADSKATGSPVDRFLADSTALAAAETTLRNLPELRGKPLFIYHSVHFYDDYRILLKVQNTENPQYVDEYYFRDGKWSEPKPVVLSKRDIVSKDLVALDDLPFSTAQRVSSQLKVKMQEIGSRSTDYGVYAITTDRKIRWYPRTIANDRSRYSIEFDAQGFLQSFEQD